MDKLSRRDFLKLGGAGAGAIAAFFGGGGVVEGMNYHSLLAGEIKSYATSLGFKDEEVLRRLSSQDLTDIKGSEFKAVFDSRTRTPLLVTDERRLWVPATRKELAGHGDIIFRNLVDDATIDNAKELGILGREYNGATLSNDWGWRVDQGDFNFSSIDSRIKKCQEIGINDFRVIAIIGAGDPKASIPGSLFPIVQSGQISKEELGAHMKKCIRETMGHLKGKNPPIDVVVINEPFKKTPYPDPYVGILGPDYVFEMYEFARGEDPRAKLTYNINDAHWSGGENLEINLKIAQELKRRGLVDTVTHQMHLDAKTMKVPADDVVKTIKSYGIKSAVSELDINIGNLQGSQRERFNEQAEAAEVQLGAVLSAGAKDVGDWGTVDSRSWLGPNAMAHDWDSSGNPKPSHYAKLRAILKAVTQ